MLPPRWVRRLVLAPAVPVLGLLLVTALPLALIAAAFASPLLPGRLRPLRLLLFVLVYLAVETAALVAMLALWVASGLGRRMADERWQAAHYAVMRHYLAVLVHTAQRTFKLTVEVDEHEANPDTALPVDASVPLVVLSRHAGPGDSFLLVHGLLQRGLRPHIVLRSALQWAPALDVGLNRLPTHFVASNAPRGSGTAAVAELAAGLRPGDALVLFPEGRNFTPGRRTRSIAKLEDLGRHDEAEQARQLRHVLTPRTGGARAALTAAPTADVIFVAHTGLEDLSSVIDLWRGLPMDAAVQIKAWRVPAVEVPDTRDAEEAWLRGWWRRIDAWIFERYGPHAIPDAVVEAVIEEGGTPPED